MNIVGHIIAADVTHEKWTCQLLWNSLLPFNNSIIDSILLEKLKNLLRNIMCGLEKDRARTNTDPDNSRIKILLLLLFRQSMDKEVCRIDSCLLDLPSFDQVMDFRTDSFLDTIQQNVINATKQLDRMMEVSIGGLRNKFSVEVQAVNKFWMITVSGNAIIVRSFFILIRSEFRISSDITDNSKSEEIGGQYRHIAQNWGAGRAKTFKFVT